MTVHVACRHVAAALYVPIVAEAEYSSTLQPQLVYSCRQYTGQRKQVSCEDKGERKLELTDVEYVRFEREAGDYPEL